MDRGIKLSGPAGKGAAVGKYLALIIGVSDYQEQFDLVHPLQDANRFRAILTEEYRFDEVIFLSDPTRSEIFRQLDELRKKLGEDDSLLIFFAGHGHWDEEMEEGYWWPADAQSDYRENWIANSSLQGYIRAFKCRHTLLISDSCYSGALLESRGVLDEAEADITALFSHKSRQVMTSGAKEAVPDQSVFFSLLCNRLEGNDLPFLSAGQLFASLKQEVIRESPSRQMPQFGPVFRAGHDKGDFIFIQKEKEPRLLGGIDPGLATEPFELERLLALQDQCRQVLPPRMENGKILLATWNIRNLGKFRSGPNERLPQSWLYLAELLSRFDIGAVQEVDQDIAPLEKLTGLMGGDYEYIFSDVNAGARGGNWRLAFIYDKRKVQPGRQTGWVVPPPLEVVAADGRRRYESAKPFARIPYYCSFVVGGQTLMLINLHFLWGKGVGDPERLVEIENLLRVLEFKSASDPYWPDNQIILGDFNITTEQREIIKTFKDHGFIMPPELIRLDRSQTRATKYSQIFCHPSGREFSPSGPAGVVNFFRSVFREQDEDHYRAYLARDAQGDPVPNTEKSRKYINFWRTFQMSDHFPLWIELKPDN